MKAVLVGGSSDGMRIEVDEGAPFSSYLSVRLSHTAGDNAEAEFYVLSSLAGYDDKTGERKVFEYYRLDGLPIIEAIQMLLEGYRQEAKP